MSPPPATFLKKYRQTCRQTTYRRSKKTSCDVVSCRKSEKLPYVLSHDLLQSIAHRDACTLLGGDTGGEGWPDNFTPDLENCQFLWFSVR